MAIYKQEFNNNLESYSNDTDSTQLVYGKLRFYLRHVCVATIIQGLYGNSERPITPHPVYEDVEFWRVDTYT